MERASIAHDVRPAAGTPEGALVLLHGRGADEQDLAPLLELLDPERRLVGILPRGPLELPPGGAHWYVVREIGYPDRETFLASFAQASSWLDGALAEAGVDPGRTAFGGFSQGAVMSYALGLAAVRPRPAAVLAMSGFIPRVDGFELDLESRAGLPVSISHGTYDPIIGVEWGTTHASASSPSARTCATARTQSRTRSPPARSARRERCSQERSCGTIRRASRSASATPPRG